MVSIAEHLATHNLSQYQPRFTTEGITLVSQLTHLSDAELDAKLSSMGFLKGHAIKFRLSLESLKQSKSPFTPHKSLVPSQSPLAPKSLTPVSQPKPPRVEPEQSPLFIETQKITAKLVEIDALREAINKSKEAIMRLDVPAYRMILDQIEGLQKALREEDLATGADDAVEMVDPPEEIVSE